CRQCREV
ncbi:hypothetical protein D018_2716B, partial [Vibrio parahaemolyticus VP2007-007]